jgi:hypothetical protein
MLLRIPLPGLTLQVFLTGSGASRSSQGDPAEQVSCLADGSLDGIFLGKSLENFEVDYLSGLVARIYRKLAPGRYIVAEVQDSVSAACLAGQPCQGMDSKTTGRIDSLISSMEDAGFKNVEINHLFHGPALIAGPERAGWEPSDHPPAGTLLSRTQKSATAALACPGCMQSCPAQPASRNCSSYYGPGGSMSGSSRCPI